jgi:hypothetical protein
MNCNEKSDEKKWKSKSSIWIRSFDRTLFLPLLFLKVWADDNGASELIRFLPVSCGRGMHDLCDFY